MKLVKVNKQTIIILLFLLSFAFYLLSPNAFAATKPTPLPSKNQISSDSADLEKIQRIKDIVASKVAELKLVEKRGFIGSVKDISGMQLTIIDVKGNVRKIDVDELTKFAFSDKTSSGISDMEKGKSYSFIGIYNKESERLLARVINNVSSIPVYFEGAILSVDAKNYQLTAVNEKGDKKTIDIQSSTKTSLGSTNGDLQKSGFSKLSTNDRILAIGFWDKKDTNLLSTLRIIHFKDVPPSKQMQSHVTVPSTTGK